MPAIQQQDHINFGTGRLFETLVGGARRPIANLTDIEFMPKIELKEAFAENGSPISVADGHRTYDITAKHYNLRLDSLASLLGGTTPVAGSKPFALDEAGAVPAVTTFTYTLVNGATYIANTLVVVGFVKVGSIVAPTIYNIVSAGSEAAGVSCSVSAAGVVTFAAGDANMAFQASYQYTSATGRTTTVNTTYQNSQTPVQLVAVKRDVSQVDGSVAQLIYTFGAIRAAGIKAQYQEGAFTIYERTYKAFADGTGKLFDIQEVNV